MFHPVIVNGVHVRSLVTGEPLVFYSPRVHATCLARITGEHSRFYKAQWEQPA